MALISWTSSRNKANSSCVQLANEHETQLKNLTLVNILILVVLIIVFIANAKEGKKMMFSKMFRNFLLISVNMIFPHCCFSNSWSERPKQKNCLAVMLWQDFDSDVSESGNPRGNHLFWEISGIFPKWSLIQTQLATIVCLFVYF